MTASSQYLLLGIILISSLLVVIRHFFPTWSKQQLVVVIDVLNAQHSPFPRWLGHTLNTVLPEKKPANCGSGCSHCAACPSSSTATTTKVAQHDHVVIVSEPPPTHKR